MDLEASIRTFALQDASISAAIGERWHWDIIPDNATYPLVLARFVTSSDNYSHDGFSGRVPLVQCEPHAESKSEVENVKDLIITRFRGYKGQMGDIYAGRTWAKKVRSEWSQDIRKFLSIVELEIGTND
jgi:hypothetical protein